MKWVRAFLVVAIAIFAAVGVNPQSTAAIPHSPSLAVLPGLGSMFQGTAPDDLGIHDRHLTPCPSTPNCVVSQNADASHAIAPIPYQGDRDAVRATLAKVLTVVPRTQVLEEQADYLRVEFSSRLLGFVDDGEFYFPSTEKVIHLRSASRLGESDLGVNRRRLEQIRLALQDLGV